MKKGTVDHLGRRPVVDGNLDGREDTAGQDGRERNGNDGAEK